MIRPFTLIAGLLFVLSGAYLFAVKHRAQVTEDEIGAAAQATRLDEQRIRVLQAQWALEADPSRLAQLSTQFTTLQPMKPAQLVSLASLPGVLPAVGSAPPGVNPQLPMPILPVPAPDAAVASAAPAPVQPGFAPAPFSAATPPAAAHLELARAMAPAQNSGPAGLQNVEALLKTLPQAGHHARRHLLVARERAPARLAAPAAQYAAALAPEPLPGGGPMGAQIVSIRAVSSAPMAAAPPPAGAANNGGSMLGMAYTPNGSGN